MKSAAKRSGMATFFDPRSIAVAGASSDPGKMGSIILANLLANHREGVLKARVYALNPAHRSIGEVPCYPTVESLPETPELLIVAVPAKQAVGLVKSAASAGVRAAILISGGFESGKEAEEREMKSLAQRHGMRILGPNTIGLVDTRSGVDSLFLRPTKELPGGGEISSLVKPLVGGVAVITQSGFLGEAVASELASRGVGVRAIVGTGNQLDVSVEDAMEYFAADPHTEVIAIYLEGVRDGRRFMIAAAKASKPVIVFKAGKTDRGARAALTHTASMVGNYDAYQAAFRRSGIVEAGSIQELVDFSMALATFPKKVVKNLAILTNAGGAGAVAADEAVRLGLRVEPMRPGSEAMLRRAFSGASFLQNSSLGNPIDLTASVSSDDFAEATRLTLGLHEYDGGVVLPTHQAPGMMFDVGERFAEAAAPSGKPVAMCIIGVDDMAEKIRKELTARGVPSFPTPERAVRAVAAVSEYAGYAKKPRPAPVAKVRPAVAGARRPLEHRRVSQLLRRYGVAEPRSLVIRSAAGSDLRRVRFPVACKLIARELIHKSDVGGVVLGVKDASGVRQAFAKLIKLSKKEGLEYDGVLVQEMVGGVELLLGTTRDPTFGPVVTIGLGGTQAELTREFILAIAPVPDEYVRELLEGTRTEKVLEGYRGGPRADITDLCRLVSSFSKILVENPSVVEAEVNPLMVSSGGAFAVDARVAVTKRG